MKKVYSCFILISILFSCSTDYENDLTYANEPVMSSTILDNDDCLEYYEPLTGFPDGALYRKPYASYIPRVVANQGKFEWDGWDLSSTINILRVSRDHNTIEFQAYPLGIIINFVVRGDFFSRPQHVSDRVQYPSGKLDAFSYTASMDPFIFDIARTDGNRVQDTPCNDIYFELRYVPVGTVVHWKSYKRVDKNRGEISSDPYDRYEKWVDIPVSCTACGNRDMMAISKDDLNNAKYQDWILGSRYCSYCQRQTKFKKF